MEYRSVTYPAGALVRTCDICSTPGKPGLLPIDRSTWHRWLRSGKVLLAGASANEPSAGRSSSCWRWRMGDALSTPTEPATVDGKALATLQARAALAGIVLAQLADGTFAAEAWGRVANLADEAAVEAFLRRAGAPAA